MDTEDRAAGTPEREMRAADEVGSAADERWHVRRDGTRFWGSGNLTPLRNGRPRGYLKVLRDRTGERRAEEALRASEARYRALFKSMDEAYAVVEMIADETGRPCDFRFLEVNPAFMAHTTMPYPVGRTATELLGTPNPRWAEVFGRVARTGEPVRFEEPESALNRVFDLNVSRLGGPGSRQVAVLFTDITARKRGEAALRLAAARDAFRLTLTDALRSTADPVEAQGAAQPGSLRPTLSGRKTVPPHPQGDDQPLR